MNTLVWVLIGLFIYWAALIGLRDRGLLPSYIGTQGPVLTLHTQKGKELIDRLARPKRFWRAWGNFGLGIALVVMVGTFLLLVVQAIIVVQNPPEPTAVTQPRNVLVIPGVNQFLPLSVAPEILLGLLIGLVVHEGGHGIFCRVEDIEIRSMGLALLAFLPVGAFVEPDEDSRRNADRGSQSRMFAAGVTNNFAITVIAFLLLFGPVMGAISVASGAAVGGVFPGSAADNANIQRGDRIVAVNDEHVKSNGDLHDKLAGIRGRSVAITVNRDGKEHQTTLRRSLLITGVAQNSPFASGASKGENITKANGNPVYTEKALDQALAGKKVATITVNGSKVSGPVGGLSTVQNGPLSDQTKLNAGDTVVITGIDGKRIANSTDLSSTLGEYKVGQKATIEAYVKQGGTYTRHTYHVTLKDNGDGKAIVGILVSPGVSGISTSSFGTQLYPAGVFHDLVGGQFSSVLRSGSDGPVTSFLFGIVGTLLLPFASLSLPVDYNFAGFVGWNSNFYAVHGPLSALGGGTFLLANVLFWTGWINLNLGFFNCIPAFPLDGGHILRMGAEAIVSRLPTSQGRQVTTMITTTIGLVMLVSLLLMVFGPRLLS